MYSRRKVFWDIISTLIRAGYTSDTAIDKVYQAYDRGTSVTSILVIMVRDRNNGGHPNLQVLKYTSVRFFSSPTSVGLSPPLHVFTSNFYLLFYFNFRLKH